MFELTTREIATVAWLALGFLWTLLYKPVRRAMWGVVRAAAHPIVIGVLLVTTLYVGAEVLLLERLGVWTPFLLKETLLWFALTGVANAVRSMSGFDDPPYWEAVVDGLKILVVVEFFLGMVPFSLPVELLLVPSVTLLVLLIEVNKHRDDEATKRTVSFLTGIQGLVGLLILALAFRKVVSEFEALADPAALLSFFIPAILSLLFLPAMFLLTLYSRYDWLFRKVQGDFLYRWYARMRFALRLGPRPRAVLEFGREHAFTLPSIRTRAELSELMRKP